MKDTKKSKTELSIDTSLPFAHNCHDWPAIGEEHNWDSEENEYFRKGLISNILERSKDFDEDIYNNDFKSSIEFINNVIIPEDVEINLTMKPGCMLCHNDFVSDKMNYALIKGLCDIKTVQYALFEKGLFFKAWYLKEHQKHINIYKKKNKEKTNETIIEILDNEILSLYEDIIEEKKLESKGNGIKVSSMRRLLKEFIDLRSQLKENDKGETGKTITFEDMVAEMKKKIKK